MAFNSFNSINRLIKISNPSTVSSTPTGLNVISQTNLTHYYDFEQSSVSGSTLKNIANDSYDITAGGSSTFQTSTYHNGAGSLYLPNITSSLYKTIYSDLRSSNNNNQTMCFFFKNSVATTPINASSNPIFTSYQKASEGATPTAVLYINSIAQNATAKYYSLRFYTGITQFFSSAVYANDVWHHICLIRNSDVSAGSAGLNVYIDGVYQTKLNTGYFIFTTNITTTLSSFVLGASGGASVVTTIDNHNISYDDFRVYNRAITTTELATIRASIL
jgi:hypothetical protein